MSNTSTNRQQNKASLNSRKRSNRRPRKRLSSSYSSSIWCCNWEDFCWIFQSAQATLPSTSSLPTIEERRESAIVGAATNVVFGIEFEEAVRNALLEFIIDKGWDQSCVSAKATHVDKDDGQTAGDIDAHIVLQADTTLRELLPNGARVSEGTIRLGSVIPVGTLVLYEAKTTWNKARLGLSKKDACFHLFWERAGKPPILILFVHGGLQKRPREKSFSIDGSTFEGTPCSFLTPTNTVVAWARSTDFYTWAPDLRAIRFEKQAQQAVQKIAQLESQIIALTPTTQKELPKESLPKNKKKQRVKINSRPRSWFSENGHHSPSRPLLLLIAALSILLIVPARIFPWWRPPTLTTLRTFTYNTTSSFRSRFSRFFENIPQPPDKDGLPDDSSAETPSLKFDNEEEQQEEKLLMFDHQNDDNEEDAHQDVDDYVPPAAFVPAATVLLYE
mmetsp:Transcript_10638/g.16081  ORF Transcript_10638/g.16081 Transcript_10638/m.16081 type:complete len:446 (-) Transcript_10638:625-1962(-)